MKSQSYQSKSDTIFIQTKSAVTNFSQKLIQILINDDQIYLSSFEFGACVKQNEQISQKQQIYFFRQVELMIKYNSTLQKEKMYNDLKVFNLFNEIVRKYLQLSLRNLQTLNESEIFLSCVNQLFKKFLIFLDWMKKIFVFLDNSYLSYQSTTLQIQGLYLFKNHFLAIINESLLHHIVICKKIRTQDQSIPHSPVKEIFNMYDEVCLNLQFVPSFGKSEIQIDSEQFYEEMFVNKLAEKTEKYLDLVLHILGYIFQEVQKHLKKEEEISRLYYSEHQKSIFNKIEQAIIKNFIKTLQTNKSTDVEKLIQNKKINEMKEFYEMVSKTKEGNDYLAEKMHQNIFDIGNKINEKFQAQLSQNVTQKKIAIDYVQQIFKFIEDQNVLFQEVFLNNANFSIVKNRAFQTFINKNDKSPLFLAIYTDILLKGENEKVDKDIEQKAILISKMNTFFYNQDIFFKYYQKFLSNRLLLSPSINKEEERLIVSKLKNEVGHEEASKLEIMLNDIQISEDFIAKNQKQLSNISTINLNVKMLTAGSWSIIFALRKVRIPQILLPLTKKYEILYKEKFQSRKISWMCDYGFSEIQFKCQEKYLLVVNTYQMIILLTLQEFNYEMKFFNLNELTNIPNLELEYNLMPLIKHKILIKSSEDDQFTNSTSISVNKQFTNSMIKIKCLPVGNHGKNKKESQEDSDENKFDLEIKKQREYIVEACIAKIMKGRKQLKFNELIVEVMNQILNFKPEIEIIKQKIESLLEKDYLKRDKKDKELFAYVP